MMDEGCATEEITNPTEMVSEQNEQTEVCESDNCLDAFCTKQHDKSNVEDATSGEDATNEKENAVVHIQSAFRGHAARKKMRQQQSTNNSNDSVEEATAPNETNEEEPIDKTNDEEPAEETNDEEPIEETNTEEPVEETNAEEPIEETNGEEPVEEKLEGEPVTETNGEEEPVAETSSEEHERESGSSSELHKSSNDEGNIAESPVDEDNPDSGDQIATPPKLVEDETDNSSPVPILTHSPEKLGSLSSLTSVSASSDDEAKGNGKKSKSAKIKELQDIITRLTHELSVETERSKASIAQLEEECRERVQEKCDECEQITTNRNALEDELNLLRNERRGDDHFDENVDEENSKLRIENKDLQHKLKSDDVLIKSLQAQIDLIEGESATMRDQIAEYNTAIMQLAESAADQDNLVNQVKNESRLLINQLVGDDDLMKKRMLHVDQLDSRISSSKMQVGMVEEMTELQEKTKILELVEVQLQSHLRDVEQGIISEAELQAKLDLKVNEIDGLRQSTNADRADYERAKELLQKTTDELGNTEEKLKATQAELHEMRNVVIEEYKTEIEAVKEKLHIAEGKCNEEVVSRLRQDVLDGMLAQERLRQSHDIAMAGREEELTTVSNKLQEALAELEEVKGECEDATLKHAQSEEKLHAAESALRERQLEIAMQKTQLVSMNDKCKLDKNTIEGNLAHIQSITDDLRKEEQRREKAEEAKAQVERNLEEKLEKLNESEKLTSRMEAEIDALQHQSKVKGMKLKFAKQRVKALTEQKDKAERVLFILPEMQKKIDEAERRVSDLQAELDLRDAREREVQEEEERLKREEDERIAREKQEWEYRTLGIGASSGGDIFENSITSRPNSAPVYKPNPPPTSNRNRPPSFKSNSFRNAPTLNPAYIESYKAGRHATRKIKMHQEKWNNFQSDPLSRSGSSKNSPTQRSPRSPNSDLFPNQMRFHGAVGNNEHADNHKHFPRMRGPGGGRSTQQPRVLVWGDVEPHSDKKLVAVGDRVLINIHQEDKSEEEAQGTGVVKYIGFINGNDEDIYVGVRMDSQVGNTDGQIEGRRYFRCDPKFGRFIRLVDIIKTLESKVIHVPR